MNEYVLLIHGQFHNNVSKTDYTFFDGYGPDPSLEWKITET